MHRLLLMIPMIMIMSCNQRTEKSGISSLDRQTCMSFADEVMNSREETNKIWNLHTIDTSSLKLFYDYFASTKSKDYLLCFGGEAGGSAGTASYLLIKASNDSVNNSWQVDWFAQSGEIDSSSIMDINHDGIKEIKVETYMMWMGECNESMHIFNLANNKENTLYRGSSRSVIDCGTDNLAETFKIGDTLETKTTIDIGDKEIKESLTIKIHDGGQTDEEIIENLKDTTIRRVIKL